MASLSKDRPSSRGGQDLFPGHTIVGDELEFQQAVQDWKQRYHRQFPAISDYLHILLGLGYAKVVIAALKEQEPWPTKSA